ncbi:MAG: DDE-type integrase/transposase/recombinase [bacterium]
MRRHVEGRESYRVIAKSVFQRSGRKISPTSLQKMVEEIGKRSKTALEMSKELRPLWDGVLLVDEKMCSVRGYQQWFYLAVDTTGDIVHCRAVSELTATTAMSFLQEIIDELPYQCRAVVTDLDTALSRAVEIMYPGKPHQYCLKHALSALESLIEYRPFAARQRWNQSTLRTSFARLRDSRGVWAQQTREGFFTDYARSRTLSVAYQQRQTLRDAVHAILFARDEATASELFQRLQRTRRPPRIAYRKVITFLHRHWNRLMQHHRVRAVPRTTNLVESVNKQLERRFKTIEAFQHRHTAAAYVNLLIAYLRQKPYTDCRGDRRKLNGHSRLHAAGVRLTHRNWLKAALKSHQNSNR